MEYYLKFLKNLRYLKINLNEVLTALCDSKTIIFKYSFGFCLHYHNYLYFIVIIMFFY